MYIYIYIYTSISNYIISLSLYIYIYIHISKLCCHSIWDGPRCSREACAPSARSCWRPASWWCTSRTRTPPRGGPSSRTKLSSRPGALNPRMHTYPENKCWTHCGSHIIVRIWIGDLRPSIWMFANRNYENWPYYPGISTLCEDMVAKRRQKLALRVHKLRTVDSKFLGKLPMDLGIQPLEIITPMISWRDPEGVSLQSFSYSRLSHLRFHIEFAIYVFPNVTLFSCTPQGTTSSFKNCPDSRLTFPESQIGKRP